MEITVHTSLLHWHNIPWQSTYRKKHYFHFVQTILFNDNIIIPKVKYSLELRQETSSPIHYLQYTHKSHSLHQCRFILIQINSKWDQGKPAWCCQGTDEPSLPWWSSWDLPTTLPLPLKGCPACTSHPAHGPWRRRKRMVGTIKENKVT